MKNVAGHTVAPALELYAHATARHDYAPNERAHNAYAAPKELALNRTCQNIVAHVTKYKNYLYARDGRHIATLGGTTHTKVAAPCALNLPKDGGTRSQRFKTRNYVLMIIDLCTRLRVGAKGVCARAQRGLHL